ncbi:hypothetical protein I6F20_17065 [Bradyrhizobium sp. IC3123]|uniref:hypothetical protein n=1 Tax=Bradyrhizobium sp. IC3123 TaxID=2793803 RepID=UPI001CD68633|nr:hypothetical protein [Bradyrhizobium sp. IC3123]MCA1390779.1 hypothetical protein [Bradyrhizobium sp. IC3123]
MISLSDFELAAVMDAAAPIDRRARDAFLREVFIELAKHEVIGPASSAASCATFSVGTSRRAPGTTLSASGTSAESQSEIEQVRPARRRRASIADILIRRGIATAPKPNDARRANFAFSEIAIRWPETVQRLTREAFRLLVSGLLNLFDGPDQHLDRTVRIFPVQLHALIETRTAQMLYL